MNRLKLVRSDPPPDDQRERREIWNMVFRLIDENARLRSQVDVAIALAAACVGATIAILVVR